MSRLWDLQNRTGFRSPAPVSDIDFLAKNGQLLVPVSQQQVRQSANSRWQVLDLYEEYDLRLRNSATAGQALSPRGDGFLQRDYLVSNQGQLQRYRANSIQHKKLTREVASVSWRPKSFQVFFAVIFLTIVSSVLVAMMVRLSAAQ